MALGIMPLAAYDGVFEKGHAMKIVETEQELRACYPVMKELRPHLESEDAFVAQIMRQREQDYHILAVWDGDEVVALAGYRYQENTVYGRFLYVDDLVTAQQHRSRRWGALLLSKLTVFAEQAQCKRLVLDTGLTNGLAQRFYFREGLLPGALRFGKDLA